MSGSGPRLCLRNEQEANNEADYNYNSTDQTRTMRINWGSHSTRIPNHYPLILLPRPPTVKRDPASLRSLRQKSSSFT